MSFGLDDNFTRFMIMLITMLILITIFLHMFYWGWGEVFAEYNEKCKIFLENIKDISVNDVGLRQACVVGYSR